MEEILKEKCTGTDFFVNELMDLSQGQTFDRLSEIVRYEMENPFKQVKGNGRSKKVKAM